MISRFFPALRMELPCLEHIEHMAMAKSQAWTMGNSYWIHVYAYKFSADADL